MTVWGIANEKGFGYGKTRKSGGFIDFAASEDIERNISKMVYAVIYDNDEIRLWWDARKGVDEDCQYKITVNNGACVYTKKVYYNFKNLEQEKEYSFKVECFDGAARPLGEAEYYVATMPVAQSALDVTKAPYFAVGDGKTDNTAALERAFRDCTERHYVYFPLGIYLCKKAFTLNAATRIRFDAGAEIRNVSVEVDVCSTQ